MNISRTDAVFPTFLPIPQPAAAFVQPDRVSQDKNGTTSFAGSPHWQRELLSSLLTIGGTLCANAWSTTVPPPFEPIGLCSSGYWELRDSTPSLPERIGYRRFSEVRDRNTRHHRLPVVWYPRDRQPPSIHD